MSYVIQKEIQFDAGHRVPLHESKCKNPHGHRYRVVAHVMGELITEGPESGMVRDFSIVKKLLTEEVHDRFDHGFIISTEDTAMLDAFGVGNPRVSDPHVELPFYICTPTYNNMYNFKIIVVPFYPTAECLAKFIFDILNAELGNVVQIDVWETPTSCASYSKDS